jgi:hypothetical protein
MNRFFFLLIVLGLAALTFAQKTDIIRNGNYYSKWQLLEDYTSTDSSITAEAAAKTLESGCAIQYKPDKWVSHLGFIINESYDSRKISIDRGNAQFYPSSEWEKENKQSTFSFYFLIAIMLVVTAVANATQDKKDKRPRREHPSIFILSFSAVSLLIFYRLWPNNQLLAFLGLFIGPMVGVPVFMLFKAYPKIKDFLIKLGKFILFWGLLLFPAILFGNIDTLWFLAILITSSFLLTILFIMLSKEADKRIAKRKMNGAPTNQPRQAPPQDDAPGQ